MVMDDEWCKQANSYPANNALGQWLYGFERTWVVR